MCVYARRRSEKYCLPLLEEKYICIILYIIYLDVFVCTFVDRKRHMLILTYVNIICMQVFNVCAVCLSIEYSRIIHIMQISLASPCMMRVFFFFCLLFIYFYGKCRVALRCVAFSREGRASKVEKKKIDLMHTVGIDISRENARPTSSSYKVRNAKKII